MNGDELLTKVVALVAILIVIVVIGVMSYYVPNPEAVSGTMLLGLLAGFIIMGVTIGLALLFVRGRQSR
jgi:TRAP-type C4-dicarboxylate transport system permease small subunit